MIRWALLLVALIGCASNECQNDASCETDHVCRRVSVKCDSPDGCHYCFTPCQLTDGGPDTCEGSLMYCAPTYDRQAGVCLSSGA